jgi:hypothetical protein
MAHTKQAPSFAVGIDQTDGVQNGLKGESELENSDRQAGHQYLPMDVYIDSKTMNEHFHASSIRRRWTKTQQTTF